eukprot:TRINITY_DN5159_c0_g1_i1.p2 TRINITY_DN5159_c0_g1~~TRINITY_DN5159_c0_g1_i1.p2  ORF type:complete len:805 (+),score=202.62 TRINITY_DN5159_c0_g1_i1:3523-5937(+)
MAAQAEVLYAYQAAEKNQISLHPHERVTILERDDSGWWIGKNSKGDIGIFPSTYVREIKEKVFNTPKERKPLPNFAEQTSAPTISKAEKLASDLGLDQIEEDDEGDAKDDRDEQIATLANEIQQLRSKLESIQNERDAAWRKMQESAEVAGADRKKAEMARTQMAVLKQTNVTLHEKLRRMELEVQDLKDLLQEQGRVVPEFKYDLPPDQAIEKFLESAMGTTRQENQALEKENEALRKELEELRAHPPQNVTIQAAPIVIPAAPSSPKVVAVADAEGSAKTEDAEKFQKLVKRYKKLEKIKQAEIAELMAKIDQLEKASAEALQEKQKRIEELEQSQGTPTEPADGGKKPEVEEMKKLAKKYKKESEGLKDTVAKANEEIARLQEQAGKAQGQLDAATAQLKKLEEERDSMISARSEELTELQQLRTEAAKFEVKLKKASADKQTEYDELLKRYRKEERLRRQLYNELQELKGNIRVYCRLKPADEANGELAARLDDNTAVWINEVGTGKQHVFEFDACFGPMATQEEIFADVRPLATSVLDGFNVCIFAYGQTGSGKTYTMEGPPDNRGVNYRTVQELFRMSAERNADYATKVSIAVIEVYLEVVYDLLNKRSKLDVKGTEKNVIIQGITTQEVFSAEDVQETLARGYECRKTASTDANEHSSRSHCILTIFVESTNRSSGVATNGKLHLIDLAGSERLSKTHATDVRLQEAKNINLSLTQLGLVISALASKKDHIPYRNSTLTRLLADSLGGNCKCLMFANISMLPENSGETVSTLKFASGARQVELGKAEVNKQKVKAAT